MRIDAHHHLWQLDRFDLPWISPEQTTLRRDFLPADLVDTLDTCDIDGSILVQTIHNYDESMWFMELQRSTMQIRGVVGWVDLTMSPPEIDQAVRGLAEAGRLVGIRHVIHDEPSVDWIMQPAVQQGLAALVKHDICYDLLIRPQHLANSIATVRRLPELRFVIDHIAKPRIKDRGWSDWAGAMAAMAKCENVWCKLSGMITEADHANWKPDDLKPYIDHMLETFGPGRLMFGSDWPVCLLAGSYEQMYQALAVNLEQLSESEKQQIYGNTAIQAYQLDASAG